MAEARRLLADLAELTIWMTGSADFGPEGQAHVGWVKGKPALDRALVYLEGAVMNESCEVCCGTGRYPIINRAGAHLYDIECPECFGDVVGVLDPEADGPRDDGERGERAP
jgi:hypothetical protein